MPYSPRPSYRRCVARPRRYLAAGAWYHITTRGNNKELCFLDDDDRRAFLHQLRRVTRRYRWCLHARCLMGNHYHLVVETREPNLSAGMRDLNGEYARAFNALHGRCDHVFGKRFSSRLIETDEHLETALEYILQNPVAAGLVATFDRFAYSCRTTPTSSSASSRSSPSSWPSAVH